jgi:F0F1-type ATP synthase membrane subunit a
MKIIFIILLLNLIYLAKFSYARLIYTKRPKENKSFQEMYMDFLNDAVIKIEQEKFSENDFRTLMFLSSKFEEQKRHENFPVYWYSRQG